MDFLLVAWVLFIVISLVNRLHRKPPPPAAALSLDQKLLTEIRDELKKQGSGQQSAVSNQLWGAATGTRSKGAGLADR